MSREKPMKILTRYLLATFCVTFLTAVFVISFVMSIGAIFKLTDLIVRGVPWRPLGEMFLLSLPQAMSFSMPMAAMITTLLVFGRLSADGEITAMKSCGVGLWQIASWPLIFSLLLATICLYVHSEIVPRSHCTARSILSELKAASPLSILEEGQFIQSFPGLAIYIGRIKGDMLHDVRIYELKDPAKKREVRAKSGQVRFDGSGHDMVLDLSDVRVDPFLNDRPGPAYCKTWSIKLKTGPTNQKYTKKPVDFTNDELLTRARHIADHFPYLRAGDLLEEKNRLIVEFHKRLVVSLSCFTFIFLGIPLGIKAHRKESSIGVAMSLLIILVFHLFIIAGESVAKHPIVRPYLILWIPVVLGMALGFCLMWRAE